MITSPDNEKLKLIRKLADRKHRRRAGLFMAEGEDLVAAAEAAGRRPEFVLRAGEDVEPHLLDSVSALGSGTRAIGVYAETWSEPDQRACVYLHRVADPGNVGAIIRTAHALWSSVVVLGPGCADPYSPKAVRASMGSIFAQPVARAGIGQTPAPRAALLAHGGEPPDQPAPATVCLGAEREGLSQEVLAECERRWTIPLRDGGAESLNVAAAAAIALGRISSVPEPRTDA
jgi:TrmH family RNA methyltransferase